VHTSRAIEALRLRSHVVKMAGRHAAYEGPF
jgi:hypothetical protein